MFQNQQSKQKIGVRNVLNIVPIDVFQLIYRRSHWRCSIKVLKAFGNFTGKHLCQSFFFNKVAGLRPVTLLQKDVNTSVFL